MQKVLEDMFGASAMGILGFALMIVMFMPKLVSWYKSRRAEKKEDGQTELRVLGQRRLNFEKTSDAEHEEDHVDHGEALAVLNPDNRSIWLQVAGCIVPVAVVLVSVYFFRKDIFVLLAILSIIPVLAGGRVMMHLGDRVVFYRTGFEGHLAGSKVSVDYNSIYAVEERKAMLPWMAPSYILKTDGHGLLVMDGSFFKDNPKKILDCMEERIKASAARESMHQF